MSFAASSSAFAMSVLRIPCRAQRPASQPRTESGNDAFQCSNAFLKYPIRLLPPLASIGLPFPQSRNGLQFIGADRGADLVVIKRFRPAMAEPQNISEPRDTALVVQRWPPDGGVITHHRLH